MRHITCSRASQGGLRVGVAPRCTEGSFLSFHFMIVVTIFIIVIMIIVVIIIIIVIIIMI